MYEDDGNSLNSQQFGPPVVRLFVAVHFQSFVVFVLYVLVCVFEVVLGVYIFVMYAESIFLVVLKNVCCDTSSF